MRVVHYLTLEISLYVNRKCQIGIHGMMAKLQGGNVPQCPIAGDANAVERQTQRVVQIKLHP